MVSKLVIGFIYGAIMGSYLTVVVWRIPRGMSLGGRSKCPNCGVMIPWYQNIPIVSWLVLRGKASCCGEPISIRYPLVEISFAVFGALLCWLAGFVVAGVIMVVVILCDTNGATTTTIGTTPYNIDACTGGTPAGSQAGTNQIDVSGTSGYDFKAVGVPSDGKGTITYAEPSSGSGPYICNGVTGVSGTGDQPC